MGICDLFHSVNPMSPADYGLDPKGVAAAIFTAVGTFFASAVAVALKWGWPWAPKAAEKEKARAVEQDSATAVALNHLAVQMKEHREETRDGFKLLRDEFREHREEDRERFDRLEQRQWDGKDRREARERSDDRQWKRG